ncbi:MAG: hypothetical protein ACON4C_09880 [Henriciella sp.]|jgi:hypothetical protein
MSKISVLQPQTGILAICALGVAYAGLSLSSPAEFTLPEVAPHFGGLQAEFAALPVRRPLADLEVETPFDTEADRQRRLAAQTVAADVTVAADPATLSVAGLIDNGRVRKVLIQKDGEETATWMLTGETIFGWSVQSITNQSVRLEAEGQVTELFLYPE